jgi:hypothetical protein
MQLPSLPNLVSISIDPVCPWTFKSDIPKNVRGKLGKAERSKWIENPETFHNCYCGWEGFDSGARISSAQEGNQPYKLHALVADYDALVDDDELGKGVGRLGGMLPAYFERTLSGYSRFVWLLESPITVPSRAFAVELLKFVGKRLLVDKLSVGFDEPAWLSPERYFTNSCDWNEVSDYRIPKSLMSGWVLQVAEKFSFRNTEGGVAVPLDVAWTQLVKLFPEASWPSEFTEGTQGPSFFVEGSSSPKSALLKAEGMYTFSAHAVKPWWSWSDLLGAQFVDTFEAKNLGAAVEGIYFDGKGYWRKDGRGKWLPYMKEDTASHLDIERKLSRRAPKGQSSEVDRALEYIRHWNTVIGAAPFVFKPEGLVRVADHFALNTFTRSVIQPAEVDTVAWGPKGPMPYISNYLGGFFDPVDQLDFFISWLKRFYCSAHGEVLDSGQNIFIVGPTGIGKTLLSTVLLSQLMGGHAVAEDYLMGSTSFNSQLFEAALWSIDDNSASVDSATHKKFSTIIKRMAANTTFEYHAKFQIPCQVQWQGRVVVTMNADEESIQLIPDLGISILDKICLFKAAQRDMKFPPNRELEAIIRRELPFLARYLINYEMPKRCVGTNRFGVESYHEPSLVQVARHSSRSNAFQEILDGWRQEYFEDKSDNWKGTSHQLLIDLNRDPARAAAIKQLSGTMCATGLSALKNMGYSIFSEETETGRIWVIPKDPTTYQPAPPQNSGRYEK